MTSSDPDDAFPRKRSFLRLPVPVDVDRLLEEYRAIPREAWASTHWDVHCSSNMVLLRGGTDGTPDDFTSPSPEDHDVLGALPYLGSLLGPDGPFGEVKYAFILRMKPLGVARPHVDGDPAWFDPFRIHVPITTNDGAHLLSEGRSKHLAVGEVWTFDNQSNHAVVNGDTVRAHLIFDALPSPALREVLLGAVHDPGDEDPERWRLAGLPDARASQPYATTEPLTLREKEELGLESDTFASRVVDVLLLARLLHVDLQVGDVVCAVDGVEECAVARTATDYVQVRHRPGETVTLHVLRQGQPRSLRLRLYDARPFTRMDHARRGLERHLHRLATRTPARSAAGTYREHP